MLGSLLLAAALSIANAAEEPRTRLDDALRLYADGETTRARAELMGLIGEGPTLPATVRRAALASLGDILYGEEGPEASRPFFQALLDEAPDYVMDPVDHPEPVCRYFEELRALKKLPPVIAPPPVLPPPRAPAPWLSAMPGGVHWFSQGKIGPGIAVGLTQAGLLVGNIVLWQALDASPGVPEGDTESEAEFKRLQLATNLSAGAFYLSLLLPPAIEFSRWSAETPSERPSATASVGIGPGSVVVRGSF